MFDILSAFLSVWDNERPKWNGNLKGFLQRCILRKYLFLAFLLSELNWKQTENGCTLWHRDDRRAWERTSKMFNFRMHRPLNLKEAAPKCMQGISCRCFRHLATCKRSLGGRFGGQLGGSIGCRVGSGSGSGRESLRGRRSDKEPVECVQLKVKRNFRTLFVSTMHNWKNLKVQEEKNRN